jgi:hypothetical protein
MNMANENRFNDGELQEIERFLRSAYITAAAKIVSARPRDPRKAVEPEIARLKQQRKPKQMRTLSDQDVRDLDEAVAGQFGSDLTKDRLLDELKRQVPNANATMEPRPFGVFVSPRVDGETLWRQTPAQCRALRHFNYIIGGVAQLSRPRSPLCPRCRLDRSEAP